jgi:predicted polyphosphate/ATP-dependent NAD kinase
MGKARQLGLIVNPIAGIGGRVGLKGSDGVEVQRRALALGAVPRAQDRAVQALERIPLLDGLTVVTCPGEMGADAARARGLEPLIVGTIQPGRTTAEDTRDAAREMLRRGVDLLLFAGGDGTARDVEAAVGTALLVLGIPAGVKIHSAAFARTPQAAGDLAALVLQGRATRTREAEVLDVDEEAARRGIVSARLYGALKIPQRRELVQSLKVSSAPGESAAMDAIAADVVNGMEADCLYVLGPGTTTRAIARRLGLEKTLVGVDVVRDGELVAADANEARLLQLVAERRARVIVTPIGGQGCILGRGNQQISPRVIRSVGPDNLVVVATPDKIHALRGRPLWVDSGDRRLDRELAGYVRVVTGYGTCAVYRVSA